MASGTYRDPTPVIKALMGNGILNKHLQIMLRQEHLSTNGVKADMQSRLGQRIKQHAGNDPVAFDRLKRMIENPRDLESNIGAYSTQPNPAHSHHYSPAAGSSARPAGVQQYGQHQAYYGGGGVPNIEFKPSPFYKIIRQLGDSKECERMEGHRHTVHIQTKSADYPELLNLDPSTRVMVFCAKVSDPGRQDISFPQQSEIKVNGEVNRKSLRGIKNKPGTTRPLDVTDWMRLKAPKYPNDIEFIYALTREAGVIPKYYLSLKLVKMVPVEDLVKNLASGNRITKASVVNEMVSKSRDEDIVVGSTVLSLKCPLSTLRIALPCRAITCRHMQCFDATSYLQLQEQAPAWQCPICNGPATFENLAVDDYVREILTQTPKSVDQVTIEPDGNWSQFNKKVSSPPHGEYDDDDDDGSDSGSDIVEIKDARVTALRNGSHTNGTPNSMLPAFNTPPGSREQSSSVGPRQSTGKRPAAVIDLTSDDEDEPLARPAKRPQYGTPNGSMLNGSAPNGFPHRGGYSA